MSGPFSPSCFVDLTAWSLALLGATPKAEHHLFTRRRKRSAQGKAPFPARIFVRLARRRCFEARPVARVDPMPSMHPLPIKLAKAHRPSPCKPRQPPSQQAPLLSQEANGAKVN